MDDNPFDNSDSKPEGPKSAVRARQKSESDGQELYLRFMIGRGVGGIIGPRGAHINELRDMTSADVTLDGPKNARELEKQLKDPSNRKKIEKLYTIKGIQEEVFQVLDKTCEFLQYNEELRMNLLVEGKLAGTIIGKGGSVINGLKEESGCRIGVDREPYKESSEKLCKISGETEPVVTVLKKIIGLLAKESKRRAGKGETVDVETPYYPTIPPEWLEGFESEKEDESDNESEKSNKRSGDGDEDGAPSAKKAKSDTADDGFF